MRADNPALETLDGPGPRPDSATAHEAGAPDITQLARMDLLSEGLFYLLWDRDRHRLIAQVFTTNAGYLMLRLFLDSMKNMVLRRRLIVVSNWPEAATRAILENKPIFTLCYVSRSLSPSLKAETEVFALANDIPRDLMEFLSEHTNLPITRIYP